MGRGIALALAEDGADVAVNYRRDAENGAYSGSFIGNWLSRILYYEIDLWIFSVIYLTDH